MKGSGLIALASSLAAVSAATPAHADVAQSSAATPSQGQRGATLLKANPLASKSMDGLTVRRLEDGSNIYNSNIQYGRCHRVKVQENNDDDGGQNYYGGSYRTKSVAFASFFVCGDNDKGQCGSCDYSTEYVMDLGEYLQTTVQFTTNYCEGCSNQCRRKLEDEAEGEDDNNNNNNNGNGAAVDCNSCAKTCANYKGGGDEVNYLDCQASYVDNAGDQLYSAPTCDPDTGDLIIDMFYDDECLIKHYVGNYYGFNYNTFSMVEDTCIDCSSSNGLCGDMQQQAYQCVNGVNQNGNVAEDDDVSACKSFKQRFTERTYNKKKKASPIFAFIVFALGVSTCFAFGSYTYYVRHRDNKVPLATLDHGDGTSGGLPQGQLA